MAEKQEEGGKVSFLSKKRNRIILTTVAFIGILLGIGAFVGVSLLRKQQNDSKSSSSNAVNAETPGNDSNSTPDDPTPTGSTNDGDVGKNTSTSVNITIESTSAPSGSPTLTLPPSLFPSSLPSISVSPTGLSERKAEVTTFYAIGDVPYTSQQAEEVKIQIGQIPHDGEFLIHVGDIFFKKGKTCIEQDYIDVAEILKLSPIPVFIVMGDNEWNDCPNPDDALGWWRQEFSHFTDRYWPDNKFNITYQPDRPDNFAFINKQTLFLGFDIVGGTWDNKTEWQERLTSQSSWAIEKIRDHVMNSRPLTPRVVIFGHANPKRIHQTFFTPLTDFIANELNNQVPILYLCGDRHRWLHQSYFYDQPSFTRIILTGKTDDPPLKMMVVADGTNSPYAFQFDRMLPPQHPSLNGTIFTNDDEYSGTDDLFADIDNSIFKNQDALNSTQLFQELQARLSANGTSIDQYFSFIYPVAIDNETIPQINSTSAEVDFLTTHTTTAALAAAALSASSSSSASSNSSSTTSNNNTTTSTNTTNRANANID